MTNPFTAFAFPASGSNQINRTEPDRIADIKNIKDFGAVGDGVTDSWPAIMSAYNWTVGKNRGIIFFPPGTYLVSQPINFGKSYTVSSGTYNSTTGIVTVTMADSSIDPFLFTGSVNWEYLNLSGTGSVGSLGGGGQTVISVSGTTVVSQAAMGLGSITITGGLLITDTNVNVHFIGVLGLSTVTGNFSDYIFSRGRHDSAGESGGHSVENLTIVNNSASGGGVRIGACVGAAVRNCNITANKGIDTCSDDTLTNAVSQEVAIENCTLDPGSNITNSEGILTVSDGPIVNCRITNYAVGYRFWGQQDGSNLWGCHFESCSTGISPGTVPGGGFSFCGAMTVSGCSFKNCSTAIDMNAGNASFSRIVGCRIDGTNGAAPGGTNPKYGINIGAGISGNSVFQGIVVAGQYDNAGIAIAGGETSNAFMAFYGVQSVSWSMPTTACTAQYFGCNTPPVFTVAELPGTALEGDTYNVSDGTNSLAWGATVTNTGTHTTHYKVRYNGSNFTVVGQ